MNPRTSLAWATLAAVAVVSTHAQASEQTDFDKARAAYLARQYDEADARFRTLLEPKTGTLHDPALVSQARMYWGAVLLAKKKAVEASEVFEKLLLADLAFEPDPLSFPTSVIDFFIDTRQRLKDRLNAAAAEAVKRASEQKAREEAEKRRAAERARMLEQYASEEKVTEKHSRLVALLPFGVGQFQNDQKVLGGVFLGVESALLIAAGVMIPIYLNELHDIKIAYDANDTYRATQLHDRATSERAANLALNGAFLVTALVGIGQAQLAYEPDTVDVRRRKLPEITLAPIAAPIESIGSNGKSGGGGFLGVCGTF